MDKKNIIDFLSDEEAFKKLKENIWPLIERKLVKLHGYSAIYIDFENFWYSVLLIEDSFVNPKELKSNNGIKENLKQQLKKLITEIIKYIEQNHKTEVRFIKAFADFNNLPIANELKIIDEIREMGIETITPYVSGYKDMSDRALIVSVMEDLLHENENLEKIFIITGDIDYYPLFEFISKNYKNEFYIVSFRNRLSRKYESVFFMKNRIIQLDSLIREDFDSIKKEQEKKEKCIENHFKINRLNSNINRKETLEALHKHYPYLKFKERDLEKYIHERNSNE